MGKKIGLHIRPAATLTATITTALELAVPLFQTFTPPNHKRYADADLDQYLSLRRNHFQELYLHGSYWINLCRSDQRNLNTIQRELRLARRLEFTHFIIHPGNAEQSRAAGIEILAQALNQLLAIPAPVKLVLENTAHGNYTVGSDLQDFAALKKLLRYPERLFFCLDTSHAYAYGYDLSDRTQQADFIDLVDATMGCANLVLIHLNDTHETLGSKIDKHLVPGAGQIGQAALQQLVTDPRLMHLPLIMELPPLPDLAAEKAVLIEINRWFS
ncbi:MAG TPA: deoxyribonuclease IV [Candidatus Babeliales bacterium]|nr:deoxyribonuclease IV [Candidatus Babeliales bacterium]